MVAAPSQLHVPQHGVDAEDSDPIQDFRVRDSVLPSQLQYSAEAAEMEVIQLPGLVRVDGPGIRSVKECRQDNGLLHLHFGVQVAAPSQLHVPQHGVDAEDSDPIQDFRVRDSVLPSQLQYSAEAAEMEVIQLPGLVRVDGPGIRSVKECRQDNGQLHLHFGVQVNTVRFHTGDCSRPKA
ncbi:unnamed protein product [Schistocephalus solidus]|uniref:PITH domain-containing protein n=1 Tax=Schistocephalus solidus TaxID=70667 RepID=A0A183TKG9_SCHSO|nr:unnamed protein product [Schistocephalus solidus]